MIIGFAIRWGVNDTYIRQGKGAPNKSLLQTAGSCRRLQADLLAEFFAPALPLPLSSSVSPLLSTVVCLQTSE